MNIRHLPVVALFVLVLVPLQARAQAAEATINILGFDADEEKILIKLHDLNQGVLIQERIIASGKIKRGKFMEGRAEEKKSNYKII